LIFNANFHFNTLNFTILLYLTHAPSKKLKGYYFANLPKVKDNKEFKISYEGWTHTSNYNVALERPAGECDPLCLSPKVIGEHVKKDPLFLS